MVKKKIAIIPARGGSKRIPNKNIVDFFGKPMIAWTIEAAQKSNLFDRVIVSTDDKKIADVSKSCGIDVPFLRTKCADDFSTVSEATIFALKQAKDYYNEEYDYVVQLMANCPLRKDKDIIAAFDNFCKQNLNFQISCFMFGWMNPWWAMELSDNFTPKILFPKSVNKRSQDLPNLYCPTGAIWIARCNKLIEAKTFYGNDYRMFPINWKSAIDIDNYDDLEMAKLLYHFKASND